MEDLEQVLYTVLHKLDSIEERISRLEDQSNINESTLKSVKNSQKDVVKASVDILARIDEEYLLRRGITPVNPLRKTNVNDENS